MTRTIKISRTIIETMRVSPEDEAHLLRKMIAERKLAEERAVLNRGQALRITQSERPPPLNLEGERALSADALTPLVPGQIVIVQKTSAPDSEGDYRVWCINEDGGLASVYVRIGQFELWEPDAKPKTRPSGRKLDLRKP